MEKLLGEFTLRPELRGTTTIGVVCRDGIIMATDTRATSGFFIAHRHVKKVFPLDKHLGMTIAGTVADAQSLLNTLQVNARLYRLDVGMPIPVRSIARLAANILLRWRLYPLETQVIIGGVDDTGARLFALDPFGSVTEEKVFSTGSGSPIALGVLEEGYREDLSLGEALELVIRSIDAAIKRDAGTGDDFEVAIIDKDGYRELSEEEKRAILKRIGSSR